MVLKIEYRRKGDHQVNPGGKGEKFLEGGVGGCLQQRVEGREAIR
jgi:hypothetical protein